MKVVKIEELKKMPNGTVFIPFEPGDFGDDQVMVLSRMYPQEDGFNGIEYLLPNMDWNLSGYKWDNNDPTKCEYPVDPNRCVIDTTDRDLADVGTGYFAVFNEREILQMIEILSSALVELRKNTQKTTEVSK